MSLPAYAPWTNPQEKVWLKFSRDILTQHGYGMQWDVFKTQIKEWVQRLREGSALLLHEVGLLPDYQISFLKSIICPRPKVRACKGDEIASLD